MMRVLVLALARSQGHADLVSALPDRRIGGFGEWRLGLSGASILRRFLGELHLTYLFEAPCFRRMHLVAPDRPAVAIDCGCAAKIGGRAIARGRTEEFADAC